MTKEQITGLVISGELMEWTTLQQGKECLETVDSGRMEFANRLTPAQRLELVHRLTPTERTEFYKRFEVSQ